MKRKREALETETETSSAIQLLSAVKAEDQIPTTTFLRICSLLLHVLDKIGPTMTVLREDIHQNIRRIEKMYETDATTYSNLVEFLKRETKEGSSRKVGSCCKAILWLTRSLDFALSLLENFAEDPLRNLPEVVEESYGKTLKPWHGWISSAAYRVALKLVPDNKTLIDVLVKEGDGTKMLKEDAKCLVALLLPILDEIHKNLGTFKLDKMKST